MLPDESEVDITTSSISGKHPRIDVFAKGGNRRLRFIPYVFYILLIGAMLVALRGQIVAVIGNHNTAPHFTPTGTPTAQHQIIINTNVSSGELTVNGKVVPFTPNDPAHPLVLTQSHSVITLRIPLFQPITCTVNGLVATPVSGRGNCNMNEGYNNIPVLDMTLTPDDLTGSQQQQLADFFAKYLNQINAIQIKLPAGEHYATGLDSQNNSIVAEANSTLAAQPWVLRQPDAGFGILLDCSKSGICATGFEVQSDVTGAVSVGFGVYTYVGWHFFNPAGDQVATFIPASGTPGPLGAPMTFYNVILTYNPSSGWSEATLNPNGAGRSFNKVDQTANNLCQQSSVHLFNLLQSIGVGNFGNSSLFPPVLAGCLIELGGGDIVITTPSPEPWADSINPWFLSHFGALLAVNDAAHALLPQLPRATANEATEVWNAGMLGLAP